MSNFEGGALLMVVLPLVLLLLPLLVMLRREKKGRTKIAQYLPNWKPILKHTGLVIKEQHRFHDYLYEQTEALNWKPFQLELPGGVRFIYISEPEAIQHVMAKKFSKYGKGKHIQEGVHDFLGNGIFAVDGQAWKAKRRSIGRFVTEGALQGFIGDVMMEHVTQLNRQLRDQISMQQEKLKLKSGSRVNTDSGGGDANGSAFVQLDIQERLFLFTMEVFLEHAFGVNIPNALEFSRTFDRVNLLTNGRFYVPPVVWKIKRALDIGTEKELREGIGRLHAMAAEIIQNTEEMKGNGGGGGGGGAAGSGGGDVVNGSGTASISNNKSSSRSSGGGGGGGKENGGSGGGTSKRRRISLVDMLVEEHSGGSGGGGGGEKVSSEALQASMRYDVLNLMLAGRDTTAVTLTWFFIEMMKRPDQLKKVREEVDAVLGKEPNNQSQVVPTSAQCTQLPYLQATLFETMRLHAPVPATLKVCNEADVLPCGTAIPKDATVCFNSYSMGRNPTVWGPTRNEFMPERFLDPSRTYSEFEFTVFNAGPRICIGKKLAIMEMTMVAACVVSQFDMEYVGNGSYDDDGGGGGGVSSSSQKRGLESLTYNNGMLLMVDGPVNVRMSVRKR